MIRTLLTMLLVLVGTYKLGAQSQVPSVKRASTRPNSGAVETYINGAGSTSINPLLSTCIDEYNRLHPSVRVAYQAVGSGAGIRLITSGKTDFAATDGQMTDDQLAHASGRILHFPVALHDVVPIYNLTQVPQLRFSGTTLAGIFLGKITMWNDPAIANDNPGVDLPQITIKVKHQFPKPNSSAGYVMADYLSKVSPDFKTAFANSSGDWPLADIRWMSGEGVAGFVWQTPGSLGYLEVSLARQKRLAYGAVKNAEGEFVTPSPESLTAAAASAMPFTQSEARDFRVSISNANGKSSYPIVSFTWFLVCRDARDKTKDKALIDFVKWTLTDGQKLAAKFGYATLPRDLVEAELKQIE